MWEDRGLDGEAGTGNLSNLEWLMTTALAFPTYFLPFSVQIFKITVVLGLQ